ncbi:minor capsid protein [Terrisporobacter sp.]|uniref:minor capsid protein n=1 Tax=Terrisporobacter sp. TaxID=1965305 RepID=UPI00289EA26E|nr:minor capsid protein [Terrisporobacter sp.]
MEEIKKILRDNGITLPISIGSLKEDNCIGLFSTAGQEPVFFFSKGYIEKNGLQIMVRHKSYEEGEVIINNVFKLLNNREGFRPNQSPFYIGRNENGYAEFSVNYIITKSEVLE